MESKVAVFGDADFVMPFSALGLDTFAVEPVLEDVEETANEILKQKYGLIVVSENIAELSQEVFETTHKKAVPSVVVVPFTAEPQGLATAALSRALKIATGIDIF